MVTGSTTEIAGAVSLVGLAGVLASLGFLHLAPTGLSPLRNAVSQYGITEYRLGYRIATISFGVAGIALATGLHSALPAPGTSSVVTFLAVFAVGRLVISWFPMDAPGSPRTPTGRSHGLIAIATFASATIAAFRLGSVLRIESLWHSLAPVSTGLGVGMAACILLMFLSRSGPSGRRSFGAVERLFYLAAIAWFAVFSVACVTTPH
jgi:hypothetical protein